MKEFAGQSLSSVYLVGKNIPMIRTIYLLPFLLLPWVPNAQPTLKLPDFSGEGRPYTHLNLNNAPDKFHFVVVPDNTGASRPGIWAKGVDKINLLEPEFVVSVGDLIQGYVRDTVILNRQWDQFNSWTRKFTMPFFYVAGNHDYTNAVMADMWKRKYGADYYHFVYRNTLFLCLNSEDGATALKNPDFSEAQYEYVREVLAANAGVRHTFVFMHQPLWLHENAVNWRKTEKLLLERKHSVFTGHLHHYALHARNHSDYFVLATMGGGSRLRGKKYGEFDHFLWVTLKEDTPVFANISLDGVDAKDVQTYEMLSLKNNWRANPPWLMEPVFHSGNTQGLWPVPFTARNTTQDTLTLTVTFPSVGFRKMDTLLPGQSLQQSLSLEGAHADPVRPLNGQITLESSTYAWDHPISWAPLPRLSLPRGKQVVVDGLLSEWEEISSYIVPHNKGSFSFGVREDDQHVYVGIKVQDSDIQAGFGTSAMNQDAIMLAIDPRPLAMSSQNRQNQADLLKDDWMFLTASPEAPTFGAAFAENLPDGVRCVGSRDKDGYSLEVAIPHHWLDQKQGKSWENFRLNLTVSDKNKSIPAATRHSWQIPWSEGVPGSGTFFRK